ncbi:MAG: serine/threonine protein kinase [Verrucomicrobiales bacterium]|jgi:serine/threonine protein kinase
MTEESRDRTQALNNLFDEAFEEIDPAAESPLYGQLCSLQERYDQAELIAVGGMKRILKVLDRHGNRHVAMARLHEDASDLLFDPFIREARLTALLEHPNVISVHDVGVDKEGKPYFTMDLKAGDGLDVVLQKALADGGYPLSERLDIFLKVCDAITYAHSRDVIHLDLKPANIQVGHYGEVLVCDWGLGKLIGGTDEIDDDVLLNPDLLSGMTVYGQVKGTPGYMAPEQIRGEDRDKRTDIYALGALLYSVLTCRPPLDGDTDAMLQAAVSGDVVPPTERGSGVPESLSAVVMKAMALKPADRYASVSDLITDVRAFLGGFSPVAHESGLSTELLLFYRRNRVSCNLAAAFVAMVVMVTALFVDRLSAKRVQAEALADRLRVEKQETETLAARLRVEKEETETLAARLRVEKEDSEALLREVGLLATALPSDLVATGDQFSNDFFHQRPLVSYELSMRSVNEMIRTEPERADEARAQLAYLYFMSAEFAKAKPHFAINPERMRGLARVNAVLAESIDPDKHKTSATQLAGIIETLGSMKRHSLAEKILSYDYASLGYREGYGLAVAAMFGDHAHCFSYEAETQTLTIDGGGEFISLRTKQGQYPLRFLLIKGLVLIDTLISNSSEIAELKMLEVADLRGSQISSMGDLSMFPQLKTLIVRPEQLSQEEKNRLRPQVRIE